MQINPKYTNNPAFNKSFPAISEVTSAKKSAPLGTSTKSCSTLTRQGLQPAHDSEKIKAYRKFTIKLKERAGEILFNPKDKKQNRVCGCGKWRIDKEMPVGVQFDASKGVAKYHNLQYCGSVWVCPDCSYKISQERKKELAEAMKGCRDKGLHVAMLTLTVPHYLGDDLKTLLKKMSKAKHSLWTNRNSREYFADQFPMVGHITATEVKYSDNNGFHPHFHILCILDKQYAAEDLQIIESELYELWAEKCVKSGLGKPNRRNGLDLKMGSNNEDVLADYISKWGMAEEMTQAHLKVGKKNMQSLTMWEVLELAQIEASTKDKYSYIFKTYASAFKGRRQLFWSKGLKELLKIEVKDDEEIANAEEENTEIYDAMFLSPQDWWTICYHKIRAEFLELVESDFRENGIQTDLKSVREFLIGLKNPKDFSGVKGMESHCS
ncbi:protein rep [Sulfitobacter sp. PR48]|nr:MULTISPECIES: protein rep [Roseobacteraceae]MDD9709822.1 protein rep [Seohaeicola sp. 4SK31]MDD9723794.1 protein rep [Sulfitobacter sp. PR48]MDD9738071.1 protein rep [Seohaeicola sp. SP36]